MGAPPTGDCGRGAGRTLVNARGAVHPETSPFAVAARTRHQYVRSGRDFLIVARVFFVKNLSWPAPSTGAFMPESAAIWNSYCAAPRTGDHPNQGTPSVRTPDAGEASDGVASVAVDAVPPTGTAIKAATRQAPATAARLRAPPSGRRRGTRRGVR